MSGLVVLTYCIADHHSGWASERDLGSVWDRQRHCPYGGVRWSSGTLPTEYGFIGQRWETGLGLCYYRARWYDPALGRFIQADTVVPQPGNPQDLNRYAYAANNPLSLIDPNGHQVRPPSSCGAICYTGTTGPYNVEYVASPAAQPLTTAGYYTIHDRVTIGPSDVRGDDGVLLVYGTPGSAQLRRELVVVHGEMPLGPATASAEYRSVRTIPLLGSGAAREYDEWAVSGGPAAQVPVLGGVSLRVGYSSGSGKLTPSVSGKVLGGSLSVKPGGVKLGYVPDVGPGARMGVDWDFGEAQFLLTSYGYLSETGLDKFGKLYAPDGVLREMYIEHGFWDRRRLRWVSGLDLLRFRVGPGWWDLPYEEVPQ